MSFENKVVIVTGATSGIGAAFAVKFAEEGAKVVLVGRNAQKLKNVSYKCGLTGSKLAIVADVKKENDLKRIVNTAVEHFGQLDILINNVGVGGLKKFVDDGAMQDFDHIMSTNLRSIVYLTHLASRHLIQSKGNIINISSIASKQPIGFAYCTSKAALDHFTRSIAAELASDGVRVNTINPGPVTTSFLENLGLSEKDQEMYNGIWLNATALKRVSDPGEIVELGLFLASDKAIAITGASFDIDNGLSVKSNQF